MKVYPRPNGNVQGDSRNIPDTNHGAMPPGSPDCGGSLAGMPKSVLTDGYASMGKITKDTASDEPDFA